MAADPLSDVLALLNPRSMLSASLHAGGAWALRFQPYSGSVIKFNAVVRGRCWLSVDGDRGPIELEAGDCFLLTRSRSFVLASDMALEPIEARPLFTDTAGGEREVRYGSADEVLVIGGRIDLESADAELLVDRLPPLILVRGASEEAAAIRWLLGRLTDELAGTQPGAALSTGHLVHLLFVQALRCHLAGESRPANGWLGALGDRRIGAAIRLLHADPARRWSLGELAQAAGMSRSNFALRFKMLVGQAPLDYLLRWRMRLAGHRLRTEAAPVSAIAEALGYDSESAFSHAFKRVTGASPLRYRNESRRHAAARSAEV